MNAPVAVAITIRPAVSRDADAIALTYLESAEYHARLEGERYWVPAVEVISARYRDGRQHPPYAGAKAITLVAELDAEIAGFIDARLEQSWDAMHRELIYCHIAEIAVSARHRNKSIGRQLLLAAEQWGRGQGADFASLEYHVANTVANALYERCMGYRAASITAVKRL